MALLSFIMVLNASVQPPGNWVLSTGVWNDNSFWDDNAIWVD